MRCVIICFALVELLLLCGTYGIAKAETVLDTASVAFEEEAQPVMLADRNGWARRHAWRKHHRHHDSDRSRPHRRHHRQHEEELPVSDDASSWEEPEEPDSGDTFPPDEEVPPVSDHDSAPE